MSIKINVGDHKRGDLFFVDPFKVIVNDKNRGRHIAPTQEKIVETALSMMQYGQRVPVECRRVADSKIELTMGFTRTEAARIIRKGFTDADGNPHKDETFSLKVLVSDTNEEEAFVRNVIENAHRNATTEIDDAHNQARLRDKNGMTNAEIAKLYQCAPAAVTKLQRLLTLPNAIQAKIHEGKLPVTAAIDLLDLPEAKREKALEKCEKEDGKIDGSALRKEARESGATKPRSAKEIKDFLRLKIDVEANENRAALITTLIQFMEGSASVEQMEEALDAI